MNLLAKITDYIFQSNSNKGLNIKIKYLNIISMLYSILRRIERSI